MVIHKCRRTITLAGRVMSAVPGCMRHSLQVALAKRERKEGRPPKKVFIKCHNHVRGRQFDSASAKSEVELLHKLSKDPALCKHLPRLERTIWLDSKSSRRSHAVSEAYSDRSPHGGGSIPANSSHVLMLEFNHRAGKLLAAVSKEVCLSEYVVRVSREAQPVVICRIRCSCHHLVCTSDCLKIQSTLLPNTFSNALPVSHVLNMFVQELCLNVIHVRASCCCWGACELARPDQTVK